VGEILRLAARTQQTSELDWKFKKKFIKGKWEQVEPNTFGDQWREKGSLQVRDGGNSKRCTAGLPPVARKTAFHPADSYDTGNGV
jgi:hypothetical protein